VEKIIGQLEGLHDEMSTMAKKSTNDGINAFKLSFVNATLNWKMFLKCVDALFVAPCGRSSFLSPAIPCA
jgi:hypothetical protein